MKLGVTVRNMGPQSSAQLMRDATLAAEQAGFESVWITDHIAIPPDDAEGSGGRYTDPLTTLAWLAAHTETLNLGTAALILPYRPALPTAKSIATLAELSGNRLLLGIGVGWMEAEFNALGVDRKQRGQLTDRCLDLLARCFNSEVVRENGQDFLFDPKPPMPPVYIGGAAPQALLRALRTKSGWLPMTRSPERLAPQLEQFKQLAREQGRAPGPVTVLTGVDTSDRQVAQETLVQYSALGIERLVCAMRYNSLSEYQDRLHALREAAAVATGLRA